MVFLNETILEPFACACRMLSTLLLRLVMVMIAGTPLWTFARSPIAADERDIRAAMLLNLTKFIRWPSSKVGGARPTFAICILGPDPIETHVGSYSKNRIDGKAVQVIHLSALPAADSCDILYAGDEERSRMDHASPKSLASGMLIVSDKPNDDSPNQIVGLPTVDGRVQIEIDLDAARRAGFIFSSRLLQLAIITR
jgi:hypothetical protein